MSGIPTQIGLASAEAELAEQPELLRRGFYDPAEIISQIRNSSKFLVLGQKGSGKSAVACKLQLDAQATHDLFITHLQLGDFPYSEFGQIVTGRDEMKFPASWKYLLSVLVYQSIKRDNGSNAYTDEDLFDACSQLEKLGLFTDSSISKVVRLSRTGKFKASIPTGIGSLSTEISPDQNTKIIELSDMLLQTATRFQSNSFHVLFLDGLDDVLISTPSQGAILGALVLEVSRINQTLRAANTPIKLVVLCRSDLYERLSNPNKNKIRQDHGIVLDWYHNPREPSHSKLIAMANQRARIVKPELDDLFAKFYDPYFHVGNGYSDVRHFLLDQTRHTPRDFLQLIAHTLSLFSEDGLSRESLMAGLRSYSQNYLLQEVKDELDGVCAQACVKATFSAIRKLGKRQFNFAELEQSSEGIEKQELLEVLIQMYETGSIGNIVPRPGGDPFFVFKFRNPDTDLDRWNTIALHKGLWKAFNLS